MNAFHDLNAILKGAKRTAAIAAAGGCLTLGLGAANEARAAATLVQSPPRQEASHAQIFEHTYGGTFTRVNGLSFTNGSITATRLDDSGDQVFAPGQYGARLLGAFASTPQSFGYIHGHSGDTFNGVFNVQGSGFDATGGAARIDLSDGPFRWARGGSNGVASSLNSDNRGGLDHMITYSVSRAGEGEIAQVLFFEGLFGPAADRELQDLVVEVTEVADNTPHSATSAPLPAAVWPGLALLMGYTMKRRRAGAAA